jgi:hypothetical protein
LAGSSAKEESVPAASNPATTNNFPTQTHGIFKALFSRGESSVI